MGSPRRTAAAIRDSASAGEWPEAEVIHLISEECDVGLLRAHRLARGWTLVQVAEMICIQETSTLAGIPRLGHHRVSRWETGIERPSPRYLDALCRLYETRPDLLGFGRDYECARDRRTQDDGEFIEHSEYVGYPHGSLSKDTITDPAGDDELRRRTLLEGLAAGVGTAMSRPLLEAVEQTQVMLRRALSPKNSVSRDTVEWWQGRVVDHATTYRTIPAAEQLRMTLLEFDCLCRLLSQRQSIAHQAALTNTTARLAGIIGILLVDMRRPKESRSWFEAGRLAAHEVESAPLQAWLTTRESLACLYYEGPQSAVQGARLARRMMGASISTASAMAPAVEARALAQLGQGHEALVLLRHGEDVFMRLPSDPRSVGAVAFNQQKLLFYKGNVMARVGKPQDGVEACHSALAAYPAHDVVDRSHIRLDEAVSLLRLGEVEASAKVVSNVLLGIPTSLGVGPVLAEVSELISLMAARGAKSSVRNTKDLLESKTRDFERVTL